MSKVCHITSAHKRYDGRIFKKECSSLAEEGYDVTLIVNDNMEDEIVNNVKIVSIRESHKKGRLQRVMSVKSLLKKALEVNAEIYHLHDPELLLLAKKLIKKNKKVIFDSHENYYEQIKIRPYLNKNLARIIAKMYYKYETHICRKISAVVFIRPEIVDGKEFNTFEGRCKKQINVANYPLKELDKKGSFERKGFFSVCYTGGLSRERGITNLVEACYLADCKLILAGNFSSEEYKKEVTEKKEFSCVDYRGELALEEVYDIYKEASVGMSTLLNEGQYARVGTFPVKVFEYFQSGLPVIISNYPYAVEMNKKYDFGICVDSGKTDEIAKAILELCNDEKRRMSLGENGYNLYKQEFNWDAEKEKIFDLYEFILDEKSCREEKE